MTQLQRIINEQTKEQDVIFWGRKYSIKPVIATEIIGDGKQLIFIGTINQRPNYWLIRIDSNTDTDSIDFDIESILQIFEHEFGLYPDEHITKEEFKQIKKGDNYFGYWSNYKEYEDDCNYPVINTEGGYHWGVVHNKRKQKGKKEK